LLPLRQLLVDGLQVGQGEFGVDHLDVGDRVDPAGDVHDVLVLEAADDVGDRVALPDVGKELVAEPSALAGAGDQAGDVDELHVAGITFSGLAMAASAVSRGSGTSTMPTFARWCRRGSSRPRCRRGSMR